MTDVLVLSREGCNPCVRVKRLLSEIARERSGISVRELSLDTEEGTTLALENGVLIPPAVFVDGALVGKTKIREEDLRRALGVPYSKASP